MRIVLDYIEDNINHFPQYQLEFKTKDTDRQKSIVRGGLFLPRRDTCTDNYTYYSYTPQQSGGGQGGGKVGGN